MTKKLYRIVTDSDHMYTLDIEPERVAGIYRNLMEGLDQQIIDNMPPEAVRKLLSQLLYRYRQVVGFDINQSRVDELMTGVDSTLEVENSFINYFNKKTEIYKGMKLIDEKLGGTTPLEVILKFPKNRTETNDDEFEDYDDES